jgi:hypothetical protein
MYYLTESDNGQSYHYSELVNVLDPFSLYKIYHTRKDYYDINNEDYYLDKSDAETPPYIVGGTHYLYYDPMRAKEADNAPEAALIKSVNDMLLYEVNINEDITNMYDVFS